MFNFNGGKCFSHVMKNPNGKGFVVCVTNVAKGVTIEVTNPIESLQDATIRARKYAGHSVCKPLNPDEVEQYLSERLGF